MIEKIIGGSRLHLSRAISLIEDRSPRSRDLLRKVGSGTGHALRIGITGPPGAGKSTLVDHIIEKYRETDQTVAVILVDPTSPFSGGAVLGDRIRMNRFFHDDGVFIRSMATRGGMGGLAETSSDVADLMDIAGFDVVIFETVGVGQVEMDIVHAVDIVAVVVVPEGGDDIQTMKAGLMEIADIFAVNKADRENAEQITTAIRSYIDLNDTADWKPPVVQTIGHTGKGIDDLMAVFREFLSYSESSGLFLKRRQNQLKDQLKAYVRNRLSEQFWTPQRSDYFKHYLDDLSHRRISVYELGDQLLNL